MGEDRVQVGAAYEPVALTEQLKGSGESSAAGATVQLW